jgi:hypothetical protein
MNWEAIGAIAELLGAIGVIASLVYLATQIRHSREQMSQNTQALRAGTYQQFQSELGDAFGRAIEVPGLDSVVRSGFADYRQLNEADAFKFEFFMVGCVATYENAYYQFRSGLLDEDRWLIHSAGLRGVLRFPGVGQWWKLAIPPPLSPDFIALVEEILGEEAERTNG